MLMTSRAIHLVVIQIDRQRPYPARAVPSLYLQFCYFVYRHMYICIDNDRLERSYDIHISPVIHNYVQYSKQGAR